MCNSLQPSQSMMCARYYMLFGIAGMKTQGWEVAGKGEGGQRSLWQRVVWGVSGGHQEVTTLSQPWD